MAIGYALGVRLVYLDQRIAVTCMAAVLATLVAVMGQLYRAESRIKFIEPDAVLVMTIVIGARGLVYFLR